MHTHLRKIYYNTLYTFIYCITLYTFIHWIHFVTHYTCSCIVTHTIHIPFHLIQLIEIHWKIFAYNYFKINFRKWIKEYITEQVYFVLCPLGSGQPPKCTEQLHSAHQRTMCLKQVSSTNIYVFVCLWLHLHFNMELVMS